ncbi:MAG TPA: hypothetical protein VHD35_17730 [Chitinophagaceae bacterium]|nr:hypothetical protein [Chitinophagaceae bacterium]
MTVTVLTKESLREFKYEFLQAMKQALERNNEKPNKWLRTHELQELLDISVGSLKKLRDEGAIKFWKDEKYVYYDWEQIEELLEGAKEKPKPRRKKPI